MQKKTRKRPLQIGDRVRVKPNGMLFHIWKENAFGNLINPVLHISDGNGAHIFVNVPGNAILKLVGQDSFRGSFMTRDTVAFKCICDDIVEPICLIPSMDFQSYVRI